MSQNSSRRFFVALLLFVAIIVGVYFFLHSAAFNITNITASGNSKVSNDEVLSIAAIELNQNIFLLDTQMVSRTVNVHPMIKQSRVVRHLPNSIEIQIVEREIWAIVPFQDVFLCLDDEGICLDKLNHFPYEAYPIITMEQLPDRVNLGQALYPQAIKNAKILWDSLLPEHKERVSEFHLLVNDLEMIVYTVNGTEIRLGGVERLEEKLAYFGYIFDQEEKFAQEGAQVLEYIDLRFQGQPVVKTR